MTPEQAAELIEQLMAAFGVQLTPGGRRLYEQTFRRMNSYAVAKKAVQRCVLQDEFPTTHRLSKWYGIERNIRMGRYYPPTGRRTIQRDDGNVEGIRAIRRGLHDARMGRLPDDGRTRGRTDDSVAQEGSAPDDPIGEVE